MAEGRGRWLLSGMLIPWSWSTLMMLVRVWAKVNVKRWGSDDWLITAAYVRIMISARKNNVTDFRKAFFNNGCWS